MPMNQRPAPLWRKPHALKRFELLVQETCIRHGVPFLQLRPATPWPSFPNVVCAAVQAQTVCRFSAFDCPELDNRVLSAPYSDLP